MVTYHSIIWTSADGNGTISMSDYYYTDDRAYAIRQAAAELLLQCGTDAARTGILSGSIDGETISDIIAR